MQRIALPLYYWVLYADCICMRIAYAILIYIWVAYAIQIYIWVAYAIHRNISPPCSQRPREYEDQQPCAWRSGASVCNLSSRSQQSRPYLGPPTYLCRYSPGCH